jgi:hypothetical protein
MVNTPEDSAVAGLVGVGGAVWMLNAGSLWAATTVRMVIKKSAVGFMVASGDLGGVVVDV